MSLFRPWWVAWVHGLWSQCTISTIATFTLASLICRKIQKAWVGVQGFSVPTWLEGATLAILTFCQGFAWTFRWKQRILNVITYIRLTFPAYVMSILMAVLYLSVPVSQDSMWNCNQMEFSPCSFNYSHFCSYCDMQNSRQVCLNIMFLLQTATVISNEIRTDTPDRMEVWVGLKNCPN